MEAKLKLLVTGASGFIGQALCRELMGEDVSVRVLLRDVAQSKSIPEELNAELIEGDLNNRDILVSACADMDVVIHLAGVAHVGNGSKAQSKKINVQGTQNLLNAAAGRNIKHFIFLSSSLAEAAESGAGDITQYGKDKLATEILVQDVARNSDMKYTILRPVNVYGPGMKGNIAGMISMIQRGRLPRLPRLTNAISLLGVHDLAAALVLALHTAESAGKIYTVTDGQAYPIGKIEQAIYQALDKPMPRLRTPAVVLYLASAMAGIMSSLTGGKGSIGIRTYRNLTRDNVFRGDEIVTELGFKPSTTLYKELPDIVRAMTTSV